MLYLPDPGMWAAKVDPVTPRDTMVASASTAQDQQLSLAAENAPIRIVYGQVTIGPQVANVIPYNGGSVILAVWCQGEVDSITQLYLNDEISTLTATHYTGTAGQGVDGTLVAAFDALTPRIAFTDAMPGVCYSVVTVPAGASAGFPRLTAAIKGQKVWNGSTTAWSDNPAYCLADFIASTTYGMATATDWASVASVAADCDALVGGTEKRRTLNLCLDTVQLAKSWVDTLRLYAGCWVAPGAAGLRLVSDKVGSSSASYSHTAGNILRISSIKKRGVQSTPTVMAVSYRDVSSAPARDATATVYAAGVLAGTKPRRESKVPMPGVSRYSQAMREATERLNKLLLNDLSFTLSVADEALAVEVGDIVDVTYPFYGFTAKLMRVMGVSGSYGRYDLALVEYDPAVYSDTVATAPTYTDTTLPSPAAPPAVTGVVMAEEVYGLESGVYSSRWRVTWAAASYSFLSHYRAELWIGSTLIFAGSPSAAEWVTPPVQEAQTYTVKIAAVSSIGAAGAWATQSATAQGKQLPPSNVPSITAFEAGGRVYANWPAAFDVDLWRYEVRYGSVGTPWASATVLDRVDALRLQSDQIPVGTWTLHVKALDSVGNYSATAATCNVTVTSDASSFLVSSYDQIAPTLFGMAEYSLARDDASRYFVTEDSVAWNTKFSSTLNTYTNALATYHGSVTSTWLGEAEPLGLDLSGQITGTATVADVSGSHISYIGTALQATPGTWVYDAGLSQKKTAGFVRLKHEALTTSTLLVTVPMQQIRLDAIPRNEVGSGTSSVSGPVTITLANVYVAVKRLTITPQGTTARSATYDNIVIGPTSTTFDVYVFNDAGTKIASPFRYDWDGV